jgi:plastocyanin
MRSSRARWLVFAAAVASLVLASAFLHEEERPYVVTAIDYHFHDAHPTLPIGPGRDLIVRNQGQNVHNVTIPALGFSRDVPPGGQVVIGSIADRLAPGRYELFCRIHLKAFGMKGVIVIASE